MSTQSAGRLAILAALVAAGGAGDIVIERAPRTLPPLPTKKPSVVRREPETKLYEKKRPHVAADSARLQGAELKRMRRRARNLNALLLPGPRWELPKEANG